MQFDDLPKTLVDFVTASIDSVEQVHVLLSLHADPSRTWTVAELTRELRSADASIERRIEDLRARGVLARGEAPGTVSFRPASPGARDCIELLAKAYRERPTRLIELIYSKPPQALQAFADSFKFRKDDDK